MNRFELYCMVFYVLDAEWDDNHSEKLGEFLSAANPFLFADIGSADPAIYADFCKKVSERIPIEHSFAVASSYVATLDNADISYAFSSIDQNEWDESVREYLSSEHKGSDIAE